uniref:early growth response protein 1-like n=1 Tax=Gasterosteus aculeatus aculeatus TaxID=481459 RepID=UPI001A9A09A8|nr:early growth response protein 1-like [Gasterosteus aculeatus aculeatus]
MAATRTELPVSALQPLDPLPGFPPPPSPLDGYCSQLEELLLLLQTAAGGGSPPAASAAQGPGLQNAEQDGDSVSDLDQHGFSPLAYSGRFSFEPACSAGLWAEPLLSLFEGWSASPPLRAAPPPSLCCHRR